MAVPSLLNPPSIDNRAALALVTWRGNARSGTSAAGVRCSSSEEPQARPRCLLLEPERDPSGAGAPAVPAGDKGGEAGGAGEARAEHLERGGSYSGELRPVRAHS